MQTNAVYQTQEELERLATQAQLLQDYELPVYQRILSEYTHATILDVGCNNGNKATNRFSGQGIDTVVGLEYHTDLAAQAQTQYGDQRFAFYGCDVESPLFPDQLSAIMTQHKVAAFDVIHISLVLLHLKDPARLLHTLRTVLSPKGQLLIIEPADSLTHVTPDPEGLCKPFVQASLDDPFSGKRDLEATLPAMLQGCGYEHITLSPQVVTAGEGTLAKKQAIFDIFCAYILEDALLVPPTTPWAQWILEHGKNVEALMVSPHSHVTVGFTIITCTPMAFFISPMEEADVDPTVALCATCVGENLYTKAELLRIFNTPNHFMNLLRSQKGELAGYSYSKIEPIAPVAAHAKLDPAAFAVISPLVNPRVLNLQATGVAPAFRKHHLSQFLLDSVLNLVTGYDVAFGLCWRPFGTPDDEITKIEHTVLGLDFKPFAHAKDVWVDVPDLVCPYCDGVCHCGATAYYRPNQSEGGSPIET